MYANRLMDQISHVFTTLMLQEGTDGDRHKQEIPPIYSIKCTCTRFHKFYYYLLFFSSKCNTFMLLPARKKKSLVIIAVFVSNI